METKTLGRYIVADPAICHGEPTFRGTRILVADVLEQVASGMAWEVIEEWRYESDKRCDCKSLFAWHVRRPPLMRQNWFRSR